MKIVQKLSVSDLPEGHKLMFFGKIDEKTFFVIHTSGDYKTAKIQIGSKKNLRETEIFTAFQYRDGGTIEFETAKGSFRFPAKSHQKPATFNGKNIELL